MEDANIDIYDDIGDFDLGNEVERLKTENETLHDRIRSLEGDVEKLTNTIVNLREGQETLKKNISTLYLTAKSEIDRKNRMISDLRTERDNICFRRFGANTSNKREGDDNLSESNIAKKFKYDGSNASKTKIDEPNDKLESDSIEPGEISEDVSKDNTSTKSVDGKARREHFDDKHHEGNKSRPRHLGERDNKAYDDIAANKFQCDNKRRREGFVDRYRVDHRSRSRPGRRYNDVQRSRSRSLERNDERYVENRGGRYNNDPFFRDERARMFEERENWADNGDLRRRHGYRDFSSRDSRYEYSKSSDRAGNIRREIPPSYPDRRNSEIYEKTNRDNKPIKTDRKVESVSKVSRDNTHSSRDTTLSKSVQKSSTETTITEHDNTNVKPFKKRLKMLEKAEEKIRKLRETPIKNNSNPSEKIPTSSSRLKEVSRNVADELDNDGKKSFKKVTPESSSKEDSKKNKHSKKTISRYPKTEDKRNSSKKDVGNLDYIDLSDEDINKWCNDQNLIIIEESSNLVVEKNVKKGAKENVVSLVDDEEDELTNAAIHDVKLSIQYHLEKVIPFQLSKDLPDSAKRDVNVNMDADNSVHIENKDKEKKDEPSSKKYLSFAEYRDQRLALKTNDERKNVELNEKQNIDVNSDAGKSDGEHVENITQNDKKIEMKKKIHILSNIDVTPPAKRNLKIIREEVKVENKNFADNPTIGSFDAGNSVDCKKEPKPKTESSPHENLSCAITDVEKKDTIGNADSCKNQDMKYIENLSNLDAGNSTKKDNLETKHHHKSLLKEYITNHTKQNTKLAIGNQVEEKEIIRHPKQDINSGKLSLNRNLDTVDQKNQPIKKEVTKEKIKNSSTDSTSTIQKYITVGTINKDKKQDIKVNEEKEIKTTSLTNLIEEEKTVKISKQQDINDNKESSIVSSGAQNATKNKEKITCGSRENEDEKEQNKDKFRKKYDGINKIEALNVDRGMEIATSVKNRESKKKIKRLSQEDLSDGIKRDVDMVEENSTQKKEDVSHSTKQDRKRRKSLAKEDLPSTTKYRKPSIDNCIKEETENVKHSKQGNSGTSENASNIAKDKKKDNLSKNLSNSQQKVHPSDLSLNSDSFADGAKQDNMIVEKNRNEEKKDVKSIKRDRKPDKSLTKEDLASTKHGKPSIDNSGKKETENIKNSNQQSVGIRGNSSNRVKDKKRDTIENFLSKDLSNSEQTKKEIEENMKNEHTDASQFKKQNVRPFDQSLNPELYVDNPNKDEQKKIKSLTTEDLTDATKHDVTKENKDRQRNVQSENQGINVVEQPNADLIVGSSASCEKQVAREKKKSLPKECLPDIEGNIKEEGKNINTKIRACSKTEKSSTDEKRETNRQTERLSEEDSSSTTHKASNLNTDHRNIKQHKKQKTEDSSVVNLDHKKKDYEKRIHSSAKSATDTGKQDVVEKKRSKKQDENRKVSDVESTSRNGKRKSVSKEDLTNASEDTEETVQGVKKFSDSIQIGNVQNVMEIEGEITTRDRLKEKVTERSVDISSTPKEDEECYRSIPCSEMARYKEENKTCGVSNSKDETSQIVVSDDNDQILSNSVEIIKIDKEDSGESVDTASSEEPINLRIMKFSDMKNILRGSIDEIDIKEIQETRREPQNVGHSPSRSKKNIPKNEKSRITSESDRARKSNEPATSKSTVMVKSDAKSIDEKIRALMESCRDDSIVDSSNGKRSSVDRERVNDGENIVESIDENRIGNTNRGQQMDTVNQDEIENKNAISVFDPSQSDTQAEDRFENDHMSVSKNTRNAHYSSTEIDTKGIRETRKEPQHLRHDARSPRKSKKDVPKNGKSKKVSESDRKSKECSAGTAKSGAGDANSIDEKIRALMESCSDDSVATSDRNINMRSADREDVNDGENIEERIDENRIRNITKGQQTETGNQVKFENKNVISIFGSPQSDVEAISADRFGNNHMPEIENTQNAQNTPTEIDNVEKGTRNESQSLGCDGKRLPRKSKRNIPKIEKSIKIPESGIDKKPKEYISDDSCKNADMVKRWQADDPEIDKKIHDLFGSFNDDSIIATSNRNVNRSSTDRENVNDGENNMEKTYESTNSNIQQTKTDNQQKIENKNVRSIFDPPKSDVKAKSMNSLGNNQTSAFKNTTPEKPQARRRITPTPVKVKPICSFENILERTGRSPFDQSPLHLTHDGEIPVLHLEENHINNLPTETNINDKNLINLLDTMNISNMECDIPKITCGTATNSGDSHPNVSPIAGTKSLTFENIIDKVTSTPVPKNKNQHDVGEPNSSISSVTSFAEKVSDSLTSNSTVNANVQSSAATQRRKRRRCRMVVLD